MARRRGCLIERLIQLRGQRRLVGEERERQAEARGSLRLHHVQRLAARSRCSVFRIQCLTCAPRLVKTILYCSFSTVVSVSAAAANGGNRRVLDEVDVRLLRRQRDWRRRWLRRSATDLLGLRSWVAGHRCWLLEILIARKTTTARQHEEHRLRKSPPPPLPPPPGPCDLKIGIAEFRAK